MNHFITDRAQYHVDRLRALHDKGWDSMTTEERREWSGDPLLVDGANLLPYVYRSDGLTLDFRTDGVVITGSGEAYIDLFDDDAFGEYATCMLHAEHIEGSCKVSVYKYTGSSSQWYDDEYIDENKLSQDIAILYNEPSEWRYAVKIEATADAKIYGLMLNRGNTVKPYVPYTPVIATDTTKGAYNYADLNRVERAVKDLSDMLGLNLVTKTDWTVWDVPNEADMKRYAENIVELRKHSTMSMPLTLVDNTFDYEKANTIERFLSAFDGVAKSMLYCGEPYCGEE